MLTSSGLRIALLVNTKFAFVALPKFGWETDEVEGEK